MSLARLGTGLFSATYRAERDGVAYSLRVPAGHPPDSQDLTGEIHLLAQASLDGLAPPLVHGDPAQGVLLLAWMPGEPWAEAAIRSPAALSQMAQLLRAVHALPIPAEARRMAPADWIESYNGKLSPPPRFAGLLARALPASCGRWKRSPHPLPWSVTATCTVSMCCGRRPLPADSDSCCSIGSTRT